MDVEELTNWEEFLGCLQGLRTWVDSRRAPGDYVSEPFFRGQEDASWTLTTTPERHFGRSDLSLRRYYNILWGLAPIVESFTGDSWELDPSPELDSLDSFNLKTRLPGYPFMAYLRTLGFPSPLLDWTTSPYVAAFFAFRRVARNNAAGVAVFAYIGDIGEGRGGLEGAPRIVTQPERIRAHERHFQQQARYTICVEMEGDAWTYCSHEKAFKSPTTVDQDRLVKFVLPSSERPKVLRELGLMNINALSLFGGEEGLVETLAFRELSPGI